MLKKITPPGDGGTGKGLKLLSFLWLPAAVMGVLCLLSLGHPCLANGNKAGTANERLAPTSFKFQVDFFPYYFKDTKVRRFILTKVDPQNSDSWELRFEDLPSRRVTDLAIEEFKSLADRDIDPNQDLKNFRNRIPLFRWLTSSRLFTPESLFNSKAKVGKLLSPSRPEDFEKVAFLSAWYSYAKNFAIEFENTKKTRFESLKPVMAEVTLSENFIHQTVAAYEKYLNSPAAEADLHDWFEKKLEDLLQPLAFKLENYVTYKKFNNQIRKAVVNGDFVRYLIFDPKKAEIKISMADAEKALASDEIQIAHIQVKVPLQGVKIEIPNLKAESEVFKQIGFLEYTPENKVWIDATFDESQPLLIEGNFVWKGSKASFEQQRFETPATSTKGRIFSINGRDFKFGELNAENLLGNSDQERNSNWSKLVPILNNNELLQYAVSLGMEQIKTKINSSDPLEQKLVWIDRGEDNASTDEGRLPVDVKVYQAGNPETDPLLNENIRAVFGIRIPIKMEEVPQADYEATTESATKTRFKGKVKIENPVIELLDPEFFVGPKGARHRLDIEEAKNVGIRLILGQRATLDAASGKRKPKSSVEVGLEGSGSFAKSDMTSESSESEDEQNRLLDIDFSKVDLENFKPVYIQRLEFRTQKDGKWMPIDALKRSLIDRTEVKDLLTGLLVRPSALVKNQGQKFDPEKDRVPEIGRNLEKTVNEYLMERIRSYSPNFSLPIENVHFADDLGFKKIPLLREVFLNGKISVPFNLSRIVSHFYEFPEADQRCEGKYRLSMGVDFYLKSQIPLRAENLEAEISMASQFTGDLLKGKIQVEQASASLEMPPKMPEPKVGLIVDVCEMADGASLDLKERSFEHSLDKLELSKIQFKGSTTDSLFVKWKSSGDLDSFLSETVQGLWIKERSSIAKSLNVEAIRNLTTVIGGILGKDSLVPNDKLTPFQKKLKNIHTQIADALTDGMGRIDTYEQKIDAFLSQFGERLQQPLEYSLQNALNDWVEQHRGGYEQTMKTYLTETIENAFGIGDWLGETMHSSLKEAVLAMLYGKDNPIVLASKIENILHPAREKRPLFLSASVSSSKEDETNRSDYYGIRSVAEVLALRPINCPRKGSAEDVEVLFGQFKLAFAQSEKSLTAEDLNLARFLAESCIDKTSDSHQESRGGENFKIIETINEWLVENADKMSIPDNKTVPLVATDSPNGLSLKPQIASAEVCRPSEASQAYLKVKITSPEVGGSMKALQKHLDGVDPFVAEELEKSTEALAAVRVDAQMINDILRVFNWGENKADILVAPTLLPNGNIYFRAKGRVALGVFETLGILLGVTTEVMQQITMQPERMKIFDSSRVRNFIFPVAIFTYLARVIVNSRDFEYRVGGKVKLVLDYDIDQNDEDAAFRVDNLNLDETYGSHLMSPVVLAKMKSLPEQINREILSSWMPFLRRLRYTGLGSKFKFKRLVMNDGDLYLFFKQEDEKS